MERLAEKSESRLSRVIYGEMMRMLARNARGAPAAEELPAVCAVMAEDYLRLPGVSDDADSCARIRAAYQQYVQAGEIDFPGLSHLIPFLPPRSASSRLLPAHRPPARAIGPGGKVWEDFYQSYIHGVQRDSETA